MQSLEQNKQTLYYALFAGLTDAVDALGNKTGGKVKSYGDATPFRANVSAARGTADAEQFGINDDYERTITTSDLNCPISEDTILWIGISPTDGSGGEIPHNYKVTRVARSLNSITYAIKKVTIS